MRNLRKIEGISVEEAPEAAPSFEADAVDDDAFVATLQKTSETLEASGIPYVFVGGIASAAYARPRWTHDIDVFVKPADSRPALEALGRAGFVTELTDSQWLYKAMGDDVVIDLIFRSQGDIYFDDEMLERSIVREFKGCPIRVIGPEDLIVMKAMAHKEHAPRHWWDSLAIIAGYELDWDYLLRRARHGARRILSLLVYAQSTDLVVPNSVIRALIDDLYEP
jgi:predicted nucleotidyltransferase